VRKGGLRDRRGAIAADARAVRAVPPGRWNTGV
jgi:hypothetical protein